MSSLTTLWAYHMLLELTVMTKPKPNQSKKDPGPRSPNPLPAYRPTPKTHRIKHLLLMLPTETTAGKNASTSLFSHLPECFHLFLGLSCSNLLKINHPKALTIPRRPQ